MRRSLFLCLALVSATTVAYGQQQQASVRVEGGQVVGQFIPDNQPEPDGYVPIQRRQVQPPQASVHQHQHAHNCTCGQCKRTVVGRTRQVFAKTHVTVVTTEHSVIEHPVQSFNESPAPCPTQQRNPCLPNPCIRQGVSSSRPAGVLASWDTDFRGYRPQQCPLGWQQQRGGSGGFFGSWGRRPLVAVNAGVSVAGFGPQVNASVGHQPPHTQAGHNYNGNYAWHGGR